MLALLLLLLLFLPVVVGLAIKSIVPKVANTCKWHLANEAEQAFFVKRAVLDFEHELVIDDFRAAVAANHTTTTTNTNTIFLVTHSNRG